MKSKLILVPGSVLILLLSACGSEQVEEKKQKEDKPLVTIQPVERKDFKHEIRVQGNVETEKDVLISAEMAGVITSISVREGQRVNAGQTLATIDASILNSSLQELETQLEYAEYMLRKQEELNEKGVGSEVELETSRNQVAALKAKIKSLNTQRGKALITAPFSGTIDQVYGKDGQIAGPQTPLFRLVNNDEVDIVASISEKHYSKVHLGTPISVSFPNYSDTTINLKITNVGNYIEPTNRTIRVRSTIKDNKFLLPNMLAEVSITDLAVDSGLVIPSKSVLKNNEGKDYVYVAEEQSGNYVVRMQEVNVVSKYKGECLIAEKSDLKAGEFVVVEGAKGITGGEIVRIK